MINLLRAFTGTRPHTRDNCLELCSMSTSLDVDADCRYFFDSLLLDHGFKQFDTNQDAHYFGMWINPESRTFVQYAEGDLSVTYCPGVDEYRAHLDRTFKAFKPAPAFITYDGDGARTEHYEDRKMFEI